MSRDDDCDPAFRFADWFVLVLILNLLSYWKGLEYSSALTQLAPFMGVVACMTGLHCMMTLCFCRSNKMGPEGALALAEGLLHIT